MRRGLLIQSIALAAAAAGLAFGQDANPYANDRAAVDVGKGMFRIYCAACHGIHAQGGRGPDLSRGAYNSGDQDADLFRTISRGVPGTEMEAYGESLDKDNIWRIVTFIRSISRSGAAAPVSGDRARGEGLYRGKGNCGSCHMIDGHGGRFGPDLSRVGRQRSYEFLRTAVVDPNLDISERYRTLTVVTRDGRKITGIERGLDNFTAQLIDSEGTFYSFDKSDVRSIVREKRSVMPDNYGKRFSAAELDDLLAYLSSLRGEGK